MTGANTLTGPTIINQGVIQAGNTAALQNSTVNINVDGGLAFSAGLAQRSSAAWPARAASRFQDATGAAVALTVGGNGASTTYGGQLSGPGSLTKIGSGTLIVSGNSTYGGTTVVSAGEIELQAAVSGFGGDGTGWTTNGGASVSGNVLTLTDGGTQEARSAFFDAPLPVSGPLQATFTYQASGSNPADGMAIVFQNDPRGPAALGDDGGSLGYGGDDAIQNSAAVEFNVYSGHTVGTGCYVFGQTGGNGGSDYISTAPVNLAAGDPVMVDLAYDGSTLTESLTDLTTGATWSTSYADVDLAAIIGGGTGYLGFTGGTGAATSTQTVSNFTLSGEVGDLLPAATTVQIAAGATLDLNGCNQTLAGLADVVPGNGGQVLLGSATLAIDAAASSTFSGAVSGSGGLTKTGAGTQILAGANTYSGPTTVNAGAIQIGNTDALQNTTVTVNVNGGLTFSAGLGSVVLGGLAGSGNVALQDAAGAPIALIVGAYQTVTTYSGVLSGPGSLTVTGYSMLSLARSTPTLAAPCWATARSCWGSITPCPSAASYRWATPSWGPASST